MDKYQKYIINKILAGSFNYFLANGSFDEDKDYLTITQDDDITITKYKMVIQPKDKNTFSILNVAICKNGKWETIENNGQAYIITVDFDDRIEKIKFSFVNNIADDYILNLKYFEADNGKFYAKQEQQKKADLLKAASVKHSTGNDLVNIYFQPCCDEYERIEITLFKDNQMLAKYKVDDGVFFKSINGLAYGDYEYIVKQFGKDNKVLLETDRIKFSINRPNYSGKPVVYWN